MPYRHGRTAMILFSLASMTSAALAPRAGAQTTAETAAPATPAPEAAAPASTPTAIAYDRSNRMTLPVTIDGAGPFGFIVDTGAEHTVISNELARTLNLPQAGSARVVGVARETTVDLYRIDDLRLAGLAGAGVTVAALDEAHIGAPGMLGIDSMANHRILFDFLAQRMDIRPSTRAELRQRAADLDPNAITVTGRRIGGRLILSDAEIGGRRIDVVIDTGAQSSIGNDALRRLVLETRQYNSRFGIADAHGANGGTLAVAISSIERINVGGVSFTDMPIAFGNSPAFAELRLSRRPALLLGMDALRMFDRVVVDFANRRVLFDLPGGSTRLPGQRMAATGAAGADS